MTVNDAEGTVNWLSFMAEHRIKIQHTIWCHSANRFDVESHLILTVLIMTCLIDVSGPNELNVLLCKLLLLLFT